jgi:hypothetical protein
MSTQTQSNLQMVVAHMNASVGPILSTEQLATALRTGSVQAIQESPVAAGLMAYLFVEVEPRLIALSAHEAGADIVLANQLYKEGLAKGMPRVSAWEESIGHLL